MTIGVYWVLRESGLKVKRQKRKDRNGGNREILKGQCFPDISQLCITFLVCYMHTTNCCCCCSVPKLCPTLRLHELQHARLPCPSLSPGVCSNSCPLNQWCHLTISSSATPFSFCFQSFLASGSFPMSQLFASGGQSIGAWIWASVLSLISFRIDWSDLLAVQGTPKGLYSTLQQMQGSSLKSSLLVFVFDLVCLCDFLGLNQCSNPWLFLTPSAISFFLLLPTLVSITYELIEVLFIQTVKNIHYIHFNRKNLSSNTFLASGRSVSSEVYAKLARLLITLFVIFSV